MVDIILIVIIILTISIVALASTRYFSSMSSTPDPIGNTDSLIVANVFKCIVPYNALVSLTGFPQCPNILNGRLFYIPSYNLTVAPFASNPFEVCVNFCSTYDSINNRCVDNDQNVTYQACMSRSKPVDCPDLAKPIAHLNGLYYYAFAVGNDICQG